MKKSIFLAVILMSFFPFLGRSQSYKNLWSQVEEADRKDHPRAAMLACNEIAELAARENNYGQLLTAEFRYASYLTQVAPDSLQPSLKRLEQRRLATQKNQPALSAIYSVLLGKIYMLNTRVDETYSDLGKQRIEEAFKDLDVLAQAKAEGYTPAVQSGDDSKIFGNDLLHVLALETNKYELLRDYYDQHNNREATCLMWKYVLDQQLSRNPSNAERRRQIDKVDQLLSQYGDLPVAGELALYRYRLMTGIDGAYTAQQKVEYIDDCLARWKSWKRINDLKNYRNGLTSTKYEISLRDKFYTSSTPVKMKITSLRHLKTLTVNVYKTTLDGVEMTKYYNDEDYKKMIQKSTLMPSMPIERNYNHYPEYELVTDSLVIDPLPVGVYLIESRADDDHLETDYSLLSVSNIAVLKQSLPDSKVRFVTVDAHTGEPMPKTNIKLWGYIYGERKDTTFVLKTDNLGEAVFEYRDYRLQEIYAWNDTDKGFKQRYIQISSDYDSGHSHENRVRMYTDRSIYRPGQTVHMGLITFEQNPDYTNAVKPNQTVEVWLRNANNKAVETKTLTTDEFGKASADFILPNDGLTGRFTLSTRYGNYETVTIRVEEYKRPTFEVKFNPYEANYQAGDTIQVDGQAMTYSGVPVQNATVKVEITRKENSYWWWYGSDKGEAIRTDTLTTDEEGHFKVNLPLTVPEIFYDSNFVVYRFNLAANVTSLSGESHPAEESIPVSNRPTQFGISIAGKMEHNDLQPITFNYFNAKGKPVEATVNYTIDGKTFTAPTNTKIDFPWKDIPSGQHLLTATCGSDKAEQKFITFSINDRRPVYETNDWFYETHSQFPNDGTPVIVQVGSSAPEQHVVYSIVANNKVIEKSTFRFSNSNRNFTLKYKEEYGDGIILNFAWVKDGVIYSHVSKIRRPLPEKKLKMKWTTFRDKLTPGQNEEWTLNILNPDGTPASAQLMATLYDKSLEQLYSHSWYLSPGFYISLPSYYWSMPQYSVRGLSAYLRTVHVETPSLRFSHFNSDLKYFFGQSRHIYDSHHRLYKSVAAPAGAVDAAPLMAPMEENMAAAKVELVKEAPAEEPQEQAGPSSPQMRENLQETAFFYPALTTDAKGDVSLRFTLPESVTTWRFIGLAHDKKMRYAIMTDEAIAQKKVMVQPNVPRFLRTGDKATISTLVVNTSEEPLAGTALLEIINPETEALVFSQKQPFSVDKNQTQVVKFNYQPDDQDQLYICRISASGTDFSDGEQHYLPILPEKELVTNTYPISQIDPGILEIDLNRLFKVKDNTSRLTVEYTDNPAWLLIQALPNVATPRTDNAIDLAVALYANKLAQYIATISPNIRETIKLWQQEKGPETSLTSSLEKNQELKSMILSETPWVAAAENETDQKHQLINLFDENIMRNRLSEAIKKLTDLQLKDGSWSWWKGMEGSYYITTAVAEMLTRLENMVGEDADAEHLLVKARPFLENKLIEEMNDIIRLERKGYKHLRPSETTVRLLYIDALSKKEMSAKAKQAKQFMLKRLVKIPREYTIYGKATAAVIFSYNNQRQKASEYMQSIEEYLVYKEEMGRYFDTRKAYYSWCDYRIPTQVHAIEAFQRLQPEKKQLIAEMQRWILQAKRTQKWNTPLNAVNAIYAFFNGQKDLLETVGRVPAVIKIDNDTLPRIHPAAGLGYTKNQLSGNIGNKLTINKSSEGVSFGGVYAQFMQKTTEVEGSAAGLKVKREILNNSPQLHVGDRIVIRITIEADRDYDFVQVEDRRAACLEPVKQLSGYHWGYYIAPQDNATNYYFNRMAKGKHVFDTEYYIDRPGDYTTGTCTAQCAYSPEFMGRQAALELKVE